MGSSSGARAHRPVGEAAHLVEFGIVEDVFPNPGELWEEKLVRHVLWGSSAGEVLNDAATDFVRHHSRLAECFVCRQHQSSPFRMIGKLR